MSVDPGTRPSRARDSNRRPRCAGDDCGARGRFRTAQFRQAEPSDDDPDGREREYVPGTSRWHCVECAAEVIGVSATSLPGPEGNAVATDK